MLTIVEFRNVAEWHEHEPTGPEADAVRAAWAAIVAWAENNGWNSWASAQQNSSYS